ncbi:MAG TPA: M28 family peptidase, partial [Gemmatimonadales bacterium]|nr:M28 family peptidase [Gemmatimonadales bacterium]
ALLLTSSLAAQQVTNNPVLNRIWAIGMDSSWTMPLAQVLLDSIGPRLTGTQGQKNGNDWLVKTYKGWGITAVNEQSGTWRGWRRGTAHIDLVAPRVRTLEGTMLGFSPGTKGKNVTAETIILPRFNDSTEFVAWLPKAKGKFVLMAAPMPTCRPTDDWATNATPDVKARMDSLKAEVRREWGGTNVRGTGYSMALGTGALGLRMDDAGLAGMVTSRPKDAWGTIEIFDTWNKKTPALAMSCEDYGLLYRLTENKQGPKLRINLDSELKPEGPIYNTIATIPGGAKKDEYVVLSSHFDSWDGASGATDNGTGTLVMLEAMRILKQVLPHPTRTIISGHWTSEENGLVGSRAYTEDHPEVLQGLQAVFNQDNGTGRIVRMGAAGMVDGGKHLEAWLAQLPEHYRKQIAYNGPGFPSGGGSDDASFACYGLPAFGMGAHGWQYGNYTWHTNRDSYDKVVFDDLRANATLAAMLAYLASEDSTMITREKVDLVAAAAAARADTTSGRRFAPPTSWPECQKAPRQTRPRL